MYSLSANLSKQIIKQQKHTFKNGEVRVLQSVTNETPKDPQTGSSVKFDGRRSLVYN